MIGREGGISECGIILHNKAAKMEIIKCINAAAHVTYM